MSVLLSLSGLPSPPPYHRRQPRAGAVTLVAVAGQSNIVAGQCDRRTPVGGSRICSATRVPRYFSTISPETLVSIPLHLRA